MVTVLFGENVSERNAEPSRRNSSGPESPASERENHLPVLYRHVIVLRNYPIVVDSPSTVSDVGTDHLPAVRRRCAPSGRSGLLRGGVLDLILGCVDVLGVLLVVIGPVARQFDDPDLVGSVLARIRMSIFSAGSSSSHVSMVTSNRFSSDVFGIQA